MGVGCRAVRRAGGRRRDRSGSSTRVFLDRVIAAYRLSGKGISHGVFDVGKTLRVSKEHEAEANCRTGDPGHGSGNSSRVTGKLVVAGVKVDRRDRAGAIDGGWWSPLKLIATSELLWITRRSFAGPAALSGKSCYYRVFLYQL